MKFDALFEFADGQSMPNNTTAVCTNVLYWDENNIYPEAGVDCFMCARVNTAPSAGTSITMKVYRYTATDINNGTLLLTGEVVLQAAATAGTWLMVVNLPPRCNTQGYFGFAMTASGDMSSGKIDAFILPYNPQNSTQVTSSNI